MPGVCDHLQPRDDAVVEVLPGDQTTATTVQGWLQAYATSRDPRLREQIILAYLGLTDPLANCYHHSAGTTLEDLIQTARAGLIAAIDRYDPDTPFVPTRSPVWSVSSSNATCGTPVGGYMSPPAQGASAPALPAH